MLRNSLFAVLFSVLVCVSYASAQSIYFPFIARGETVPPANVQAGQRVLQDAAIQYLLFVAQEGDVANDWLTHLPVEVRPLAREIADAMVNDYVFSTQMNVIRYFVHVYRVDSADNASLSPLPNKVEAKCHDLAVLLGADGIEPVVPDAQLESE